MAIFSFDNKINPWQGESRRSLLIELSCLMVILLCSFLFLSIYFVPVYTGVDPNGYHGSARCYLEKGDFGYDPADDFTFIGRMWVLSDNGRYYAKYPPFYPWLCAEAQRFFGRGADLWLNPFFILMTLPGIYLLGRAFGLGRWSIAGPLILAVNPVFIFYGLRQVSHPSSLFFITWGYALLGLGLYNKKRYWMITAIISAGLMIGFSAGIRYTNVLLVLPGLFLTVIALKEKKYLPLISLLAGIAVPWLVLGFFHWEAFGAPWRTGYDLTSEQGGFSLRYFLDNVRFYIMGISGEGLGPVLLPAVAGYLLLCRKKPISAVFLGLWIWPLLLLYIAYYWAPDQRHIGFLRFLLPVFVPAILLAVYLAKEVLTKKFSLRWRLSVGTACLALTVLWGLSSGIELAEKWYIGSLRQLTEVEIIRETVPSGSVLITDNRLQNFLYSYDNYRLYPSEIFYRWRLKKLKGVANRAGPSGLQQKRARILVEKLAEVSGSEYQRKLRKIIDSNQKAGREIYFAMPPRQIQQIRFQLFRSFEVEEVKEVEKELPPWQLIPPPLAVQQRQAKKAPKLNLSIMKLGSPINRPFTQNEEMDAVKVKMSNLWQEIILESPEIIEELQLYRDSLNHFRSLKERMARRKALKKSKNKKREKKSN